MDLNINGARVQVQADAAMPVLWVLRDVLQMTGTKFGCGVAACGACTVRVDGVAQRSCMQLAVQADGRKVDTVEGLNRGAGSELGDLQSAVAQPSPRTSTRSRASSASGRRT